MITADASVLVPAVLASHEFHEACYESAGLVDASIGHVLIETYSVLTRLPQPYTVVPAQASTAVQGYAFEVMTLPSDVLPSVIDRFASSRVSGGATYDALVGATARHHDAGVLTRDERAAEVYERLGVDVTWVST